jgi:cadmium resistance protein CadD (predicted permease)
MESSFALLGLAIALFASTNLDDVSVLIGFFADPKFHARDIVFGQYAGITALFGVSLVLSLLSLVIPRPYLGLLGISPILIGAKKLVALYHEHHKGEATLGRHSNASANGRSATVALVTIANGGDNIGIYAPSFAIRSWYEIAVIALVFVVMTGLWCFAAHSMVNHPKLGSPIRRYGHRAAPVVLVGLGVLILLQAGSFGLLFRHGGR